MFPASRFAAAISTVLAICLVPTLADAQRMPVARECPQPRFTSKAPDEYYQRENPLPPDTGLRAARQIFLGDGKKIACASCHGEKGDGRGPMSEMFEPRPRNFACSKTVNDIPDGQLFWIIRFGSPGTPMPPHPELDNEQVWQLVLYLRTLAKWNLASDH
jgi:mono/diheme cytochrome c family protein